MSRLLDIAKVAEILGIDTKTLRCWDDTGKLKAIRTPGNQRRYREEDINTLINEEMIQDLVSVMTCFSAKIYGVRGGL